MIDFLSKKLSTTFQKIKDIRYIDSNSLEDIYKDIKKAFLESDINYNVTIDFINQIKKRLSDVKLKKGKIGKDAIFIEFEKLLINALGNNEYKLKLNKKPTFILILGLQGSGKTTSISKLAYYLKNTLNKRVLVVNSDTQRPAAYEQLKKLCNSFDVNVFYKNSSTPLAIVQGAIKECENSNGYDVVLFDTAGRTTVNEDLMSEIVTLYKVIKPNETIINIDALSGQSIIKTINDFKSKINVSCAILSKFDSESKSGAAFSITHLAKLPILFVGTGEKINNLEKFYPDRVVQRIMGYGDLLTLTEKAEESLNETSTKAMIQRISSGKFDLEDLIKQTEQMKKLGSFRRIVSMMPGSPNISKEQIARIEEKLKIIKTIANSTTLKERRNISLLSVPSRKNRIIKGSGTTQSEYNKLLKQIRQMKEQSKNLKQVMKNKQFNNFR